jgi:hypothetical protein
MPEKEFTLNVDGPQSLYEFVQEQLKDVDTTELSDDISQDPEVEITPEKVYFWTRVYMKEENPNINIGDIITIKYLPSGEELKTQFITYGKSGLERNHDDELINFNPEDDKKVLCLMVDEKEINESDNIPFIRTLFRLGHHYEYNVMRRDELIFTNDKNGIIIDWFDCDF